MIHLDTHVLVWLYGGEHRRIPAAVRRLMNADVLAISAVVELELQYLWEIDKVATPAGEVLAELVPRLELARASTPMTSVIQHALPLSWTRDPFDRLIAGTALAEGATLLTADRTVLDHVPSARWD